MKDGVDLFLGGHPAVLILQGDGNFGFEELVLSFCLWHIFFIVSKPVPKVKRQKCFIDVFLLTLGVICETMYYTWEMLQTLL
jgi:hypothetical protein